MTPADYPRTVEEALELADRYPEAECWRRHRRKVLGTPEPLPRRFMERLAATVAEDPGTFGQIVMHALRALEGQEANS